MKRLRAVLVCLMGVSGAMAHEPFQLSLTPDIALFDPSERIEGLTLNIWGENPQSALAIGAVNGSAGDSAGLSLAFILNYADNYKGLQCGLVNYAEDDVFAWQGGYLFGFSVINYTGGTMKGIQTGVVNCAGKLNGLQLGLVNYAVTVENGMQVGLVNLMPQNEWFTAFPDEVAPVMVIVNWQI